MMHRALLLVIPFALAGPPALAAQTNECNPVDLPDVQEVYQGTNEMTYVQGPFLVRCANGAELRANQGTLNRLTRELLLVGNVDYRDPQRTLTSDQATYTSVTRRLYATGNVVFTDRVQGTTIRGPELEYFATTPDRPEAQVNAGSRPHLTLMPRDTSSSADPLEIDADRLTIIGNDDLTAYGSVVITRPDLEATASEAHYDGEVETLELRQNAVVKGRENVLSGDVIDAQLENGDLKEVRSRGRAVLEAKDMRVTAPDVQLFFRAELVERTVARGDSLTDASSRPLAVTKTFRLVADSIDAVAPGQQLETVTAIGNARGETVDTTAAAAGTPPAVALADSASANAEGAAGATTPPADSASAEGAALIASDWIAGDTIIGYFSRRDSTIVAEAAAADTAVELNRIVARGAALSLYRMQRDSATAQTPAATPVRRGVNFVSADEISLSFSEGEVDVAELHGVRRGIYLDPAPPGAPAPGAAPAGPSPPVAGVARE